MLKSEDQYYFTYHAVSWQPAVDENGAEIATFDHPGISMYDVCLQFYADADGEMGYVAPKGMEFGTTAPEDQGKYLQRLAVTGVKGQERCVPQNGTEIQVQLR